MTAVAAFAEYVAWHYLRGVYDLLVIWGNVTLMVVRLFSVPLLLRTFLSPWKRIEETSSREGDIEDFFASMAVNLMSRLVGAFIRIWLIAFGLIAILFMLVMFFVLLACWLLAPLAAVASIVYGFTLVFPTL